MVAQNTPWALVQQPSAMFRDISSENRSMDMPLGWEIPQQAIVAFVLVFPLPWRCTDV